MRREKWGSIRPKECHIHQGIISMRTEKVTISNLLRGLGRFWSATNLNFSRIRHQTSHCVAWSRWTVFVDKYSSDSHRCPGLSITSIIHIWQHVYVLTLIGFPWQTFIRPHRWPGWQRKWGVETETNAGGKMSTVPSQRNCNEKL